MGCLGAGYVGSTQGSVGLGYTGIEEVLENQFENQIEFGFSIAESGVDVYLLNIITAMRQSITFNG